MESSSLPIPLRILLQRHYLQSVQIDHPGVSMHVVNIPLVLALQRTACIDNIELSPGQTSIITVHKGANPVQVLHAQITHVKYQVPALANAF